jgi:hypothetical protein
VLAARRPYLLTIKLNAVLVASAFITIDPCLLESCSWMFARCCKAENKSHRATFLSSPSCSTSD